MAKWRYVDSVKLAGMHYSGPAWIKTTQDSRGRYISELTAVVPTDTPYTGAGAEFLPWVHGTDNGGYHNSFFSERFFCSLGAAKRWATMKLRAQSGNYSA